MFFIERFSNELLFSATGSPPPQPSSGSNSNANATRIGIILGILLPSVCCLCLVSGWYYRKQKKEDEEQKASADEFRRLSQNHGRNGGPVGFVPEYAQGEGMTEGEPQPGERRQYGQVGLVKGFMATPHLKSWVLSLTIWVLLIMRIHCDINFHALCWCRYRYIGCSGKTDYSCVPPCDFCEGVGWPIVFTFLLVGYLVEIYFCSTRKYVVISPVEISLRRFSFLHNSA